MTCIKPVNARASNEITQLLVDWSNGRQEAFAELLPVVYGELRRAAGRSLRRERSNHALSSTALVNASDIAVLLFDPRRAMLARG
jgi:hypothetical protein